MSKQIILSDERIISLAPPEVQEWGYWQFPTLYQSNEKVLYLNFSIQPDSCQSYGKKGGQYQSLDHGKTWQEANIIGGFPLPDGTMIRPKQMYPIPLDELTLPKPIYQPTYGYVKSIDLYDMKQIDPRYTKWYIARTQKDSLNGELLESIEEISVTADGYLMRASSGILITPFFYNMNFFRRDADTIFAVSYHPIRTAQYQSPYYHALYFQSKDNGKSFELLSIIPFKPPYPDIEHSEHCQGFLEPSLCFINEKTAFTLLRTTCVKGISPLYIAWSYDGCKTWTEPTYFDEFGVYPQSLQLNSHISLIGYGRPGLYIRLLCDGEFTEKVQILPPEVPFQTCSYCALEQTGPNQAIIVYSKFNLIDEQGRNRKGIVCRDIQIVDTI
ncbi:MAG: sialidase family protein [Candidatus Merdivicinus sp.]